LAEIEEEKIRLIKLINDEQAFQKGERDKYSEEIQKVITQAQNSDFSQQKVLLEKMRGFLYDSGSATLAQRDALEEKKNALRETIKKSEVAVYRQNSHSTVNEKLHPLSPSDLGNRHSDFDNDFYRKKTIEEINDLENELLELIAEVKPVHAELASLIDEGQKVTSQNPANTLPVLFGLAKYRNSSPNEGPNQKPNLVNIIYSNNQRVVNRQFNRLLEIASEQKLVSQTVIEQLKNQSQQARILVRE